MGSRSNYAIFRSVLVWPQASGSVHYQQIWSGNDVVYVVLNP
jgi:hypothetical protein